MRTLDAVTASLEGNSWFTTIDLVDGFFSLPLYPADRGYTAFHTPIGTYKWDVLPQGTAASPAIFQRVMDRWFAAFLWRTVIVWIDDILVFSKDFSSHLKALRGVFAVLREYGLVASRRKLKCCMRSVRYLGYIFGTHGIRADPDKLAAVHSIPEPKSRKQVRQFLGFANFYRRFLPPNFSTVTAPLTALTSEKNPFHWDKRCQAAFNKVKLLLTSTPVLVHPNFDLPFHIHCDASGKGVGAVLSQYVDGAYRPIAFCSKRLLPHQCHWSPAQLEAYAIFHAVAEKWRYYLTLSKCVIHSDHRNLIWLMNHQNKGMIGRWYAALTAFDLDISYVSGASQLVADPLSRLFQEREDGTYAEDSNPTPELLEPGRGPAKALSSLAHLMFPRPIDMVYNLCGRRSSIYACPSKAASKGNEVKSRLLAQFQPPSAARIKRPSEWAEAQRDDDRLGPIYRYLASDATALPSSFSSRVRARAQSFRLINGILHYRSIREVGVYDLDEGWVIAVPFALRQHVISECHGDNLHGHGGGSKTVLAIRQRYHFRNVRKAVQKYISLCEDYIRAKSQQTATSSPLTPMISSRPFSAIAIDLYSPGTTSPTGHRYVLTTVDLCTRWVSFVPLKTKYPSEVMWALATTWFHVHGIPQVILSDRGKEFLGTASAVCAALGIRHIKTTPYHPRTNGLCESQHKSLTYELRIRVARPSAPQWDSLLTEIAFSHNVTPAKVADGLSPFNLVFGRKPRLSPEDICFPVKRKQLPSGASSQQIDEQKYANALQTRLQGLRFRALDKAWEVKEDLRERYDRAREGGIQVKGEKRVSIGDVVSICHPTKVLKKQTFQWSPPHFLVISVSTNTCEVRSLIQTGGKHLAQLRKTTGTVPS